MRTIRTDEWCAADEVPEAINSSRKWLAEHRLATGSGNKYSRKKACVIEAGPCFVKSKVHPATESFFPFSKANPPDAVPADKLEAKSLACL